MIVIIYVLYKKVMLHRHAVYAYITLLNDLTHATTVKAMNTE